MKWKGPSDYGCRWRDVFAECDERVGAVVSLQNTQTRVSGLRNLAWVCVCVHMCAWMSFIMWNTALKADFFVFVWLTHAVHAYVLHMVFPREKQGGCGFACMYVWMNACNCSIQVSYDSLHTEYNSNLNVFLHSRSMSNIKVCVCWCVYLFFEAWFLRGCCGSLKQCPPCWYLACCIVLKWFYVCKHLRLSMSILCSFFFLLLYLLLLYFQALQFFRKIYIREPHCFIVWDVSPVSWILEPPLLRYHQYNTKYVFIYSWK